MDRTRQDKPRLDRTRQHKTRQGKTRLAQVQMSRGILPQSDSDWGEFLLTFELGLFSLLTHHPLLVYVRGGGSAYIFRDWFRGTYHGSSLAPVVQKTKQDKTRQDKTRQDRTGQDRTRQDRIR